MALNCGNLSGITVSCANNVGGIEAIIINDHENVTATPDTATHTLTALSATPKFTVFELKRDTSNVSIEPQIDFINGSTFYVTTVTLMFHRREAAKSAALMILGSGQRYLDMVFKDSNGLYWFIDNAQLSGGPEETGTAKGDGSKYTVTFVANMTNRPYNVSEALYLANK